MSNRHHWLKIKGEKEKKRTKKMIKTKQKGEKMKEVKFTGEIEIVIMY